MEFSRTVLVTGASGFIGSKLVERLCAAHYQVRTFGRANALPDKLAHLPIEHCSGDITNLSQVQSAVRGCSIVFHLAGLVSYRQCDIARQYAINVIGTRNVLQASEHENVSRLIHTSSVAAMGIPNEGEIGTEELAYNLFGKGLNYCDTKYEAELEVKKYCQMGVPALIVNPGIVFGEDDTHPHHHAIFAAMSKGRMIGVPAGGVAFSDINDVVQAHLNAITMGRVGERYALVSANLSYHDAALIFADLNKTRGPLFTIPGAALVLLGSCAENLCSVLALTPPLTRQIAWLSQYKIFFSSDKAVRELAFSQTPFAETVRRTSPFYLGVANRSKNDAQVVTRTL